MRRLAVYAHHWLARPLLRLLGVRRPSDGFRKLEYRAYRRH
jgi:hypothetical protein